MDRDETRLVERLRRQDEAAFNELVRLHQGPVYRLLLRMLGEPAEAEEVAQEVFITVFKAIANFRGDAKLSTWLYRIATNHGKNRIKYHARRSREAQRPLEGAAERLSHNSLGAQVARPDQLVEGLKAQGHIQQALGSLDEEQRALVVLRDIENLSYEEIQRVTGLPSGTVKSRLHRARMALHMAFQQLQGGRS